MIEMLNCDCMEYMATLPDKAFDLAIVDPPYGINADGRIGGDNCGVSTRYAEKEWDSTRPPAEYFTELKRVSKNQIIWGGNYFADLLEASSGWIFWDKHASGNFSDGELAWTSFEQALKKFDFTWNGMRQGDMKNKEYRIHPTQKPVALYKWLLSRYAKQGDKILDTHGGSGSICIACHDLGFDLTWMELDVDYYKAACRRYKEHAAQTVLFEPQEIRQKTNDNELDLIYTQTNKGKNKIF